MKFQYWKAFGVSLKDTQLARFLDGRKIQLTENRQFILYQTSNLEENFYIQDGNYLKWNKGR